MKAAHVGMKVPQTEKELWQELADAEERTLSQWVYMRVRDAVAHYKPLFKNPTQQAPAGKPRRRMNAV